MDYLSEFPSNEPLLAPAPQCPCLRKSVLPASSAVGRDTNRHRTASRRRNPKGADLSQWCVVVWTLQRIPRHANVEATGSPHVEHALVRERSFSTWLTHTSMCSLGIASRYIVLTVHSAQSGQESLQLAHPVCRWRSLVTISAHCLAMGRHVCAWAALAARPTAMIVIKCSARF